MIYTLTYSDSTYHAHREAIYLDRDGILNRKVEGSYVLKEDQLELLPNAIELMKLCWKITPWVFLISNQRCVEKGLLTLNRLKQIDRRLWDLIGFEPYCSLYCPDTSEDRKPSSSMIHEARKLIPVRLDREILIGDSITDKKCAFNAGIEFSWCEDAFKRLTMWRK